ncbi:MAG: hypothetical protein LJE67_02015 [Salaquimonas sp.]|jgi:hypothetical protein|nr:hypothetical protein [Salaquimonas sp.]
MSILPKGLSKETLLHWHRATSDAFKNDRNLSELQRQLAEKHGYGDYYGTDANPDWHSWVSQIESELDRLQTEYIKIEIP